MQTRTLALLVGIGMASACATRAAPISPAGGAEPHDYGGRPGVLPEGKARLAAATRQPALDALLRKADRALKVKPPSVTHKTKPGAIGNLHDYASQAPYFWPNPATSNGLPYIARDGRVNPESRTASSDQEHEMTLLAGPRFAGSQMADFEFQTAPRGPASNRSASMPARRPSTQVTGNLPPFSGTPARRRIQTG